MKINLLTLLFLLTFSAGSFGQQSKEQRFQKTIQKVIRYYTEKDDRINQLIDKESGIYFLIRQGTGNWWIHSKVICFKDSCNDNLPEQYSTKIKEQKLLKFPLRYGREPNFDCDKANKEGLFTDTLKKDNLISETIKHFIKTHKDEGITISKKELANIYKTEKAGRRIVLAKNISGGTFIFYLTYLRRQWFLSAVDFITADCSV